MIKRLTAKVYKTVSMPLSLSLTLVPWSCEGAVRGYRGVDVVCTAILKSSVEG